MKCSWPRCRRESELDCPHGGWCDLHFDMHLDDLRDKWRDQWTEAKHTQAELMSR